MMLIIQIKDDGYAWVIGCDYIYDNKIKRAIKLLVICCLFDLL